MEEKHQFFSSLKTESYAKPLHLSQRIVEEAEDYAIISINVKVNKELESLILSFGEDIEVMAPASFRDRIAEKIQATNKKYTDK